MKEEISTTDRPCNPEAIAWLTLLATGAASSLGADAGAAVVYQPLDVTLSSDGTASQNLVIPDGLTGNSDIDGNKLLLFEIDTTNGISGSKPTGGDSYADGYFFMDGGTYVDPDDTINTDFEHMEALAFALNDEIGPGTPGDIWSPFVGQTTGSETAQASDSLLLASADGTTQPYGNTGRFSPSLGKQYFGFAIDNDTSDSAEGTSFYYGWLGVEVLSLDDPGTIGIQEPISVKFTGIALETELDTPILAGVLGLEGDLNGDGFVGLADLDIVLGNWNQSVTAGSKPDGDPSGDGFVGLADLDTVLGNWNAGTPPFAPDSAVPEPGSVALLALGAAGLTAYRRRK